MANRTFQNFGHFYAPHTMPVLLDCNFVVDSTNANGLGISSLKGPGISAVYMHSTAPVAANPNPANGTIIVRLQDNYNRLMGLESAVLYSPLSGSALKIDNSALTAGVAYVITVLGDATAAQWLALGVPAGVTPAVGVAFVALSVGAGANTSTSRVQAVAAAGSGIASIENLGNANLSIAPSGLANQGYGAQLILQARDYAGALAAPADGTILSLQMYLGNSSVLVQGE